MASSEEKKKNLEQALQQIEKQFGKGAIMRMNSEIQPIDVIPTGCLPLDMALGVGGVPRGRIIEIYGPESSGKTTLALSCIAEAQKLGGIAAFIDAEHALDPVYAQQLGINIEDLYLSQPDSGEQALDIVEKLVRSGAIDIIVVDSVAALTPQAEIDGEMSDALVGTQARLMSKAMRVITGIISKANCCVIFINQLRDKVGVMYGNPETTTGGKALKFYATIRMDIRKGEAIKDGSEVIGNKVKVKIVKNKVAPPFKAASFDILYGQGISKLGSLVDMAVACGVIQKSGSWFSYNEERVAQGREKTIEWLKNNPELVDEIEKAVRANIRPGQFNIDD
ncbi:MAG: recombinase RecA [Clostridia bacterium]|nr:recombinase RecA [Clostridia bacterium]